MAASIAPAEERSYLGFAAAALALALGAGLTLGVLIGLTEAGALPIAGRLPRLIQAHGWTQLLGWTGLFVAGMGLRLMPRLSGRRPLPSVFTIAVLSLLTVGVLLRLVGQAVLTGRAASSLVSTGGLVSALGMLALAGALAVVLARPRRSWQAWWVAAWAGTAWWAVWALLSIGASSTAVAGGGLVPQRIESVTEWVALLGAISNFAWAVQARSVPVFYGRRQPGLRLLGPPLLALNVGIALVLASLALPAQARVVEDAGLGLSGLAMIALAPIAGSIAGRAHRLRPASRHAAAFIRAANLWALVAGLLLLAAAAADLGNRAAADRLRDAALHATGLGFLTTLILGMAQLLMPVFAGRRAITRGPGPESWLSLPALTAAAAFRVAPGVFAQAIPAAWGAALIATSGGLAWIALATFAVGMGRAALLQAARPPTGKLSNHSRC